ncbi:hypothetical protein NQU54_08215, partial [Streptomyces samsunensis]|nr:hypothetical protein [Streptomyces samsunensis]
TKVRPGNPYLKGALGLAAFGAVRTKDTYLLRRVSAVGAPRKVAERRLKEVLANRASILAQPFWGQIFGTSRGVLVGHSAGDQGV